MKNRFGVDWSKAQGSQFWSRPGLDRRVFFRHAGAALAGSFFLPRSLTRAATVGNGHARNVVFVLLAGGISHSDTFDLKEGAWTPAAFEPESYGEIRWPRGLMPRLAEQLPDIALVRSVRAWALVHGLAQTWVQIGRNPLSGLSKIAPHIGSVVSRESGGGPEDRTLPAFVSLNASSGPAQGYFEPLHAPFYVTPAGNGLGNTTNPAGPAAFERRHGLLMALEGGAAEEIGPAAAELALFNTAARKMMYNDTVDSAFRFSAEETTTYGGANGFARACLTARNLLKSNLGTRFIQITMGGWDNHANIYNTALNAANANSQSRQLDAGLSALLTDLKRDGLLNETLVVVMGEFGRTVGPLNGQGGRDHFLTQSVMMAGAGIRGGRAIGVTDDVGRNVVEPGWAADREIRTEDIEATIYAALGIDWTKTYYDDPLGRGFSLVPLNQGIDYRPVSELWS
ncbi:MAG: DUF1501 domain-containing protein [Bryobacteraceae bacterium]|nr:DUF1501 domain-containing protein [Bryobacteraceae bacterium]